MPSAPNCGAEFPSALPFRFSFFFLLPNAQLYAIAARDVERATKTAEKYNIPKVHITYQDLANDPDVDIVYIPSPNGLHMEHSLMAIQAGKHVLCEKPLTNNQEQAIQIQDLLKKNPKIVYAEAFHWKCHPAALFLKSVLQGARMGNW